MRSDEDIGEHDAASASSRFLLMWKLSHGEQMPASLMRVCEVPLWSKGKEGAILSPALPRGPAFSITPYHPLTLPAHARREGSLELLEGRNFTKHPMDFDVNPLYCTPPGRF